MAIEYAQWNPFRDCADPGSAIPSSACDRALAALEKAIVAQRSPIVLLGPIGTGKTLLLRRIVNQPPPSIRAIFLPWVNVPPEEVIPWIHGFEATEASGDDFVAAACEFHAQGVRTLLLIDEAQSMPRDSATRLAELVSEAGGAIQVLLAGLKGDSVQAVVAAFHGHAEYVELAGEVTPLEVAVWAQNTLEADELSRLRVIGWTELVQRARGIPRLVRWELECQLARGDLAAVLGRGRLEALDGEVPVKTAKLFEVVPLPTARSPTESNLTEGSVREMRPTMRRARWGPSWAVLSGLRKAVRSGKASREAPHAVLLGQRLRQIANWIRDAATPRTESVAAPVASHAADASAYGRAALHNVKDWCAHSTMRLVFLTRSAFTRVPKRGAATFRIRRTTETLAPPKTTLTSSVTPAVPQAITREHEPALEPVHVRRLNFLPNPPGSKGPWRMPEMRSGPLLVLALVLGGFLLGRLSALPNVEGSPHDLLPREPAIVSAGPPPDLVPDKTIAPQPPEVAHEPRPVSPVEPTRLASEAQAERTTPAPAPKPSRMHKRKVIKRVLRPSPPAAPTPEVLPAAPIDGNEEGWVIRRR